MLGVIILAGGRGTRMGGTDKASVTLGGERLIDRLLRQLPYGVPTSVVSPYHLGMPQVCESPLFGGPVAGIAAGHAALNGGGVSTTAILAVDAPDSPQMLPVLERTLVRSGADVAVATLEGRIQPLCALWRTEALQQALDELGDPRDQPVMRLLRLAENVVHVVGTEAVRDIDTVDELRARREARQATQR
ncbi:molybdenum cofactor guanylyltransferase [Corynebacterium singulare]|uniref:molybdenum cofactor guanylyltransferase n=1 Tax=Corynebacterium singulare TaxID=161899 RepID=UPI0011AA81AA|nr:NTP transferase domain-containing protein [Corynebacterium singulare]